MDKEIFYRLMKRQNEEWRLIDKGIIKEDTLKPYKPRGKKFKVKSKYFI